MNRVKFPIAYKPGSRVIAYPDDRSLFSSTEVVDGYVYAGYSGELELEPANVVFPVTSVAINNAQLVGQIWWVQKAEPITLTASCSIPNGSMIVMVERIINASEVVDDIRFKADIAGGVLTISGVFDQSGNYQITEDRINAGLDRIGAGFNISMDRIEFDVFV
ncbi:hypothetical protein [Pontibacterium sp.]|uniref:hypothetical protein n=1 Tax=Pontibacterium sp. TaxID=2036026 RepID=UPI003566750B